MKLLSYITICAFYFLDTVLSAPSNALDARAPAPSTACKKISPKPQGSVCGVEGRIKRNNNYEALHTFAAPQVVNDFEGCRDLCATRRPPTATPKLDGGCRVFAFDSANKICLTYGKSLGKVFEPAKTGVEFWELACFNCPETTCPQDPSVNLIDDGDFETSDTYFGPFINPYLFPPVQSKIVHPGLNSRNAFRCRGMFCSLQQYRLLCYGQRYILSFDFMVTPGPNRSTIYAAMGDAYWSYDMSPRGTEGKWKHVEMTFQNLFQLDLLDINWSPSCSLCKYYVYIDNVSVYPYPGSVQTIPGSELAITNANFETGKLSPWSIVRYTGKGKQSVISPGLRGSKYAWQYVGNPKLTYDDIRLQIKIPPCEAFQRYVLRFDYRITGMVGLNPFLGGAIWDTANGLSSGFLNYTIFPPQNTTLTFERLWTCGRPQLTDFFIDPIKEDYDKGPHPDVVTLDNFYVAKAK